MTGKKEVRAQAMTILNNLDPITKAFESMGKCLKFIQGEYYMNAEYIFAFMPSKDEVDVCPVLRQGLSDGKKIVLPRVVPGTNDMDFYFVEKNLIEETAANSWGIYEPVESCTKCDAEKLFSEIKKNQAVILVPGLAFGKDGSRMGRGKGFYDKFLSKVSDLSGENRPTYIGVCYDAQISEKIPCDDHDVFMDMLF